MATAPPARRLLLVEAPGPWGRTVRDARMAQDVGGRLTTAAARADVRVQLVRSPGRHPAVTGTRRAWALADPDEGAVRWGTWREEADLLAVDLVERLDPAVHAATGPQRLALVCAHGRHDLCCAVRGRPVAAALAAAPQVDRQVWETSHLGGDRFAANVLLLPEGEVFGGLDERSAPAVVRALDGGRLVLPHYRGRVGRSPVVQAALHLAADALGDDRRGAVRVLSVEDAGDGRHRVRVGHAGREYRLDLVEGWAPPERLTCAALQARPARYFILDDLRKVEV